MLWFDEVGSALPADRVRPRAQPQCSALRIRVSRVELNGALSNPQVQLELPELAARLNALPRHRSKALTRCVDVVLSGAHEKASP